MPRSNNPRLLDVPEFYDLLAPDYYAMTGFDQRFVREKPFFRLLIERFNIKTALDAGSGSGFHSVLLSQLGVQVTAVDASAEMVRLTTLHARKASMKVKALKGSFEDLQKLFKTPFDAIFVMGNSLAHVLSRAELKEILESFSGLLAADGILFLQCLNYERILKSKQQIQSTRESEGKTFVRSYEYDDKGILFSVRTNEKGNARTETIRLRPVMREELVGILTEAGLPHINVYGGISMEQFDPLRSIDLVVLARKNI
jgi:glycine/sarcosine/dimethylglycine N-methyltransferase